MTTNVELEYKGFKICVQQEKCLGGWDMKYYQIIDKDGEYVIDNFTEDITPIKKYANGLKELVDDIIKIHLIIMTNRKES